MSIPWSKWRPPLEEYRLTPETRELVKTRRRQMYLAACAGSRATVLALKMKIRGIKLRELRRAGTDVKNVVEV